MNTGFLKLLTVALIVVFFAVFLLLPIYTVVEEGLRLEPDLRSLPQSPLHGRTVEFSFCWQS